MKSLLFVISALAIFAGTQADFDGLAWCKSRSVTHNVVLFKANPENKTEYFQCERTKTGIVAHKLACKKCFEFSDDKWTCLQVSSVDCPTEAPITEVITYDKKYCYVKGNGPAGLYLQLFAEGSVRYKYLWAIGGGVEIEVSCPPGTYFDFVACKCLWCDGGLCAGSSSRAFTLDFDHPSYQNGIYFDFDSSIKFVSGPSSLAAQFDGLSSSIEVPYFQNNQFSQFTFVVSFKRYSGEGGPQGIFYQGGTPLVEDLAPPSIYVYSLSNSQVVAGIRTTDGDFEIDSNAVLSANVWVSLIFRYDGASLDLWVNDVHDFVPATGLTLQINDELKIGYSFDSAGTAQYFYGELDDLSWYGKAIPVPIPSDYLPPN